MGPMASAAEVESVVGLSVPAAIHPAIRGVLNKKQQAIRWSLILGLAAFLALVTLVILVYSAGIGVLPLAILLAFFPLPLYLAYALWIDSLRRATKGRRARLPRPGGLRASRQRGRVPALPRDTRAVVASENRSPSVIPGRTDSSVRVLRCRGAKPGLRGVGASFRGARAEAASGVRA
jgi:uncharacterized membrane protein